ncbi:unnamed protein product [Meloidogyne enterolobii]|uniref:Uncharacterized protein n=1 Tax=Meloidogyne enterolobii TaxID=390850 RepID=A0ACB0YE90_MELEN
MEYSHIEICLKFENPGNYFIIIFNHFNVGWLQFYVQIRKENEERCVFKMFKKISELEKEVLKSLRQRITIYISKSEVNDIEDGQMNVYYNESLEFIYEKKYKNLAFVAMIEPVIDGSYEF